MYRKWRVILREILILFQNFDFFQKMYQKKSKSFISFLEFSENFIFSTFFKKYFFSIYFQNIFRTKSGKFPGNFAEISGKFLDKK